MSAQELVNGANKSIVGLPVNINKLINQLSESEDITHEQAAKKIYLAINKWRKDRLPTAREIV